MPIPWRRMLVAWIALSAAYALCDGLFSTNPVMVKFFVRNVPELIRHPEPRIAEGVALELVNGFMLLLVARIARPLSDTRLAMLLFAVLGGLSTISPSIPLFVFLRVPTVVLTINAVMCIGKSAVLAVVGLWVLRWIDGRKVQV